MPRSDGRIEAKNELRPKETLLVRQSRIASA